MISKESIGVEISQHQLAIAYLKATPFSTRICAHAVYDLDAGGQPREKMEAVRAMVKDFLRQHRIGSACIWIGLAAGMVIQRVIRLPSAARENLTKTLEYELPKYLPLQSEDIYFRYQILDEDRDERQLTILVAAVKKKDLAPLIELRNQLGAGICGAESAATAAINGLKWASASISEKSYGLAYAADNTLHLGGFEDGQVRFIRTLDLDADLTDQLQRIFREFDDGRATGTGSDATAGLHVYCHGPDATPDVLRKLNESPNLEFSRLDLHQGPLADNSPIAGTGLALKSLQPVAVDINLLPEQFRKKPSVIARYLTIVLVLLTLITGTAWTGSYFIHQRITDRRVDRELDELSGEIKTLGQAQSQIAALQERIDYLNTLRQDRIHALEFLKELTETLPDTAWLRGLSVAGNQVLIEGYADYSTQLIQKLESSSLFSGAKFISTITRGRDGKEVFKIGFEINRQSGEGKK
jgi:general secretion pathway protein L